MKPKMYPKMMKTKYPKMKPKPKPKMKPKFKPKIMKTKIRVLSAKFICVSIHRHSVVII